LASLKWCGCRLKFEVSAALRRPGIKTRDLKRQSGLMRETVAPAPRMPSCCNAELSGYRTFLFIAVVSPLALLPPSVDSTLTMYRTWSWFEANIFYEWMNISVNEWINWFKVNISYEWMDLRWIFHMNEWMNISVNEWINWFKGNISCEWMDLRWIFHMNEWMNEWINWFKGNISYERMNEYIGKWIH